MQVYGKWVNVGTVGHLDYSKVLSSGLFVAGSHRCEPLPVVAEQCETEEKQKPTKNHKLFDRWGRLK